MTINFGTATTKNAGCAGCEGEKLLVDMSRTDVLETAHETAYARFRAAGSLSTTRAMIPTADRSGTTKLNEPYRCATRKAKDAQEKIINPQNRMPGSIHNQLASVSWSLFSPKGSRSWALIAS